MCIGNANNINDFIIYGRCIIQPILKIKIHALILKILNSNVQLKPKANGQSQNFVFIYDSGGVITECPQMEKILITSNRGMVGEDDGIC